MADIDLRAGGKKRIPGNGATSRVAVAALMVAHWLRSARYGTNAAVSAILCDRCGALGMLNDTIGMASDHAGFDLKQVLKFALQNNGNRVVDLGVDDPSPVDYPDFGYAMAHALREGRITRGVLICGSGIGISIAANRYPEVRAALIHDELGARLAREHNDANVICFGGRMIGADVALECLRVFLATPFEGGRHCRRVDKLSNPL